MSCTPSLRRQHNGVPTSLVLATQGHQDFLDALRGNTTERVVRGARCPVLAVPDWLEPSV